MSEPRRKIRVVINSGTGEPEVSEVNITPEEEARQRLTRGVTFVDPTENLQTAARAASAQRTEAAAGRELGGALTFGAAVGDTAGAGTISAGLSDTERETLISAGEQRPELQLAGSLVGGLAGLPGMAGAVPIGRLAAMRAAARLGQGGARIAAGTTEGVFGGLMTAIEQANINDDEVSEHLLSNVGLGALFGVGGEALLGFGNVFGRQATSQISAAVDQAAGAQPGFLRRAQQTLSAPFSDADVTELPGLFRRAQPVTDAGGIEAMNRQMGSQLAEQVDAGTRALNALDGPAFLGESGIGARLADVGEDAVAAVRQQLAPLRQTIEQLGVGAIDETAGIADRAARALRSLENGLSGATGVEAASAIFDTRRQLTSLAEQAPADSAIRRQLGGFGESGGAVGALDQLPETLFGEAGEMLASRATVLDDLLKRRADLSEYVKSVAGTETISNTSLFSAIEKAGLNGDDVGLSKIHNYFEAVENANALLGSVNGQDLTSGLAATRKSFMSNTEAVMAHRRVERLRGADNKGSGLGAVLGIGGGAGIGFLAAGPVGALVGGVSQIAAAAITRPVLFEGALHRVRQLAGRNAARATRSLANFDSAVSSSQRLPRSGIKAAPGTIANVLFNGSKQKRRDEYEQLANRIEELISDPAIFARVMGQGATDLHNLSPGLVPSLATGAHRGASILAGALPPARLNRLGQIAMQAAQIPASQTEVDSFLEIAAVIEDPFFGVELMNAGRLSPNAAGAIREMYPRIHAELTAVMAASVGRRQQRGQTTNYQSMLRLSNFAGVPLDATLEPDFLMAMQSQSAQTTAQERAQFSRPVSTRRPGGVIDSAMSMTQSLESGR